MMEAEKEYVRIGSAVFYDGKPISMGRVIEKLNTLEAYETGYGGCCWTCEIVALENIELRDQLRALPQP